MLAVANRRVIDELPTVAVVSGILSGNLDASADDDRARARTRASRSARRVTRTVPITLAMVTRRDESAALAESHS